MQHPFRLEVTFACPPVLPDYLHMDSIVAAALANRTRGITEEELVRQVSNFLTSYHGIFLASTFWIAEQEDETFTAPFVRRFTLWDVVKAGLMTKERMAQKTGPNRAWMGNVTVSCIRKIVFWGVGKGNDIAELIEDLGYIGKHTRAGFGKIQEIQVQEDEYPFIKDGAVTRFWPAGLKLPDGQEPVGVKLFARRRFPYWLPEKELCFAPKPMRLRVVG